MAILIITAVFCIVWGAVCGMIAESKGRPQGSWFLAGCFLGPIALILVACMGSMNKQIIYVRDLRDLPSGVELEASSKDPAPEKIKRTRYLDDTPLPGGW